MNLMAARVKAKSSITSSHQFRQIIAEGKCVRGFFMDVWISRGKPLVDGLSAESSKYGIIVSRKTDARAAGRNLWKRRIREALRKLLPTVGSPVNVIVRPKKGRRAPAFHIIEEELLNLLSQEKLL